MHISKASKHENLSKKSVLLALEQNSSNQSKRRKLQVDAKNEHMSESLMFSSQSSSSVSALLF